MTGNLPLPYDPVFALAQTRAALIAARVLTDRRTGRMTRWATAMSNTTMVPEPSHWDSLIDPIMGRPMYFDRLGNPITILQWGELREIGLDADGRYGESSYIRIGEDEVGEATVSTVWLGIDHGFPGFAESLGAEYKPVIFETMIFGGRYDRFTVRYSTEWEAIKGHAEVVTDLRAGMQPGWAYGGQEDDEWRSQP